MEVKAGSAEAPVEKAAYTVTPRFEVKVAVPHGLPMETAVPMPLCQSEAWRPQGCMVASAIMKSPCHPANVKLHGSWLGAVVQGLLQVE